LTTSSTGEEEAPVTFEGEHKHLVALVALLGSAHSMPGAPPASTYTRDALAVDFAILLRARDAFSYGGPKSVIHTFPPLIQRLLDLGESVVRGGSSAVGGVTARTLFSAVHESTRALAVAGHTEEAVRLFCAAAENASIEPEACQEFLSQGACARARVKIVHPKALLRSAMRLASCSPPTQWAPLATRPFTHMRIFTPHAHFFSTPPPFPTLPSPPHV